MPESLASKGATMNIGPGQYDVDSTAHKQLMAAIYPKKSAPFNSTAKKDAEKRSSPRSPGKFDDDSDDNSDFNQCFCAR